MSCVFRVWPRNCAVREVRQVVLRRSVPCVCADFGLSENSLPSFGALSAVKLAHSASECLSRLDELCVPRVAAQLCRARGAPGPVVLFGALCMC